MDTDISGQGTDAGLLNEWPAAPHKMAATTEPEKDCVLPRWQATLWQALMPDEYVDDQDFLANHTCHSSNTTSSTNSTSSEHKDDLYILDMGLDIYAFLTPFIILTGIIGNTISLRVFLSRRMRQMSASLYLAALASSDTLTLMVYVFLDWLHRGLPRWPGDPDAVILHATNSGLCQAYLYLSYIFRFLSAWIIVLFTGERYIGVCKPLHRRAMCTNSFAKRAIMSIVLVAACLSIYKPILVEVTELDDGRKFCTHKLDYKSISFKLDAIYGTLITIIPFTIITCLNLLIMRRLRLTRRRHLRAKFASEETTIRLEFTAILMVVSTTFIVLNLPYFVVWCYNFQQQLAKTMHMGNPTQTERTRGWLLITKTIFYGNYCVNFFIYSLTGGYFRKQLRTLCNDTTCCGGPVSQVSRPSGTGFNGNVPTTSTSHIPLQSRGL